MFVRGRYKNLLGKILKLTRFFRQKTTKMETLCQTNRCNEILWNRERVLYQLLYKVIKKIFLFQSHGERMYFNDILVLIMNGDISHLKVKYILFIIR